jgi:hypothetical protein
MRSQQTVGFCCTTLIFEIGCTPFKAIHHLNSDRKSLLYELPDFPPKQFHPNKPHTESIHYFYWKKCKCYIIVGIDQL